MFKKKDVEFIYRLICLLIFIVVIVYVKSIVTLSILALFFVFLTRDDLRILALILYFVTAMAFMGCIYSVDYTIFRVALVFDTVYYFLIIPPVEEIVNKVFGIEKEISKEKIAEKTEEVQSKLKTDNYYIRFSNQEKINKKKKSDALSTIYITAHLLLLFVAIMVG